MQGLFQQIKLGVYNLALDDKSVVVVAAEVVAVMVMMIMMIVTVTMTIKLPFNMMTANENPDIKAHETSKKDLAPYRDV